MFDTYEAEAEMWDAIATQEARAENTRQAYEDTADED
jgi:hypothetical protein